VALLDAANDVVPVARAFRQELEDDELHVAAPRAAAIGSESAPEAAAETTTEAVLEVSFEAAHELAAVRRIVARLVALVAVATESIFHIAILPDIS
jgi:hypothetical protein